MASSSSQTSLSLKQKKKKKRERQLKITRCLIKVRHFHRVTNGILAKQKTQLLLIATSKQLTRRVGVKSLFIDSLKTNSIRNLLAVYRFSQRALPNF